MAPAPRTLNTNYSTEEAEVTVQAPDVENAISVYWQTGCTSCLRVKEFLAGHGIPFRSRDVLKDEGAMDELARFGLRQVPIVVRGNEWANGQILGNVARLCGIPWGNSDILPAAELQRRLNAIMAGAERFTRQLPESSLQTHLPNRPRSYADLVYHLYNVVDAFVEHEEGIPLVYESYYRLPPKDIQNIEGLIRYGAYVAGRFSMWFAGPGKKADWGAKANVYYGSQSLHEFLERTTWHSGQHARQLMWVLENMGISPDQRLGEEAFSGLPMPEKVWEDEEAVEKGSSIHHSVAAAGHGLKGTAPLPIELPDLSAK